MRLFLILGLSLVPIPLMATQTSFAQGITLKLVTRGLSFPVAAVTSPNESDRLYIVDSVGLVRVLKNGNLIRKPFLDLRDKIEGTGESGLVSLAFHPAYKSNGRFFVTYTKKGTR